MPTYARLLLLVGTPVVVLAFIGAVYFQIYAGTQATRDGWILTRDVSAGAQLAGDNVQRARVAAQGTPFLLYDGDPIKEKQRASHPMKASHLLAPDDMTRAATVLVPISFGAAPDLHQGDSVDVYVALNGRTVQVGRGLFVETSTSIWVPASDEPYWVALQANKAAVVAVRSTGAGVPATDPVGMQQAVSALTASAGGGQAPPPTPVPTPPPPAPSASPSPSR
jgi:hypothetical protein